MEKQQFLNVSFDQLRKFSTHDLINEIMKLKENLTDGAQLVFNSILDILMIRLNESDFLKLCDQL